MTIPPVHCSFCRKSQRDVWLIIAGPTVYICDECIDLCNEIVEEKRADQQHNGNMKLSRSEAWVVEEWHEGNRLAGTVESEDGAQRPCTIVHAETYDTIVHGPRHSLVIRNPSLPKRGGEGRRQLDVYARAHACREDLT